MLNIPTDFREFIKLLNDLDVRYLIVGGYAVAYHGVPRATGDIDFLLELSEENAKLVKRALDQFGFQDIELSIGDLTTPDQIIQLGYPPLRIDLLTSIDGISFEEAWKDHLVEKIDGLELNLIGLANLIKNKKASKRPQDIADVEKLESH